MAESNAREFGEPPVVHWPQWIRVRVGGELSYTKMLTGAAVERRPNLTPLDYRHTEDLGEEQIPGPPQVGGRYLLVCEQSLHLKRETRLIMEGEAPTPPLYTRARIVPLHEVESVVTQTMPPPATETGMMTSDLEIAHTKNLVMARIGALTQGAGIEVWMLQNFIRSLGANRETLSRARLLIECINASVRYREPIHFRIEPWGNRLIGEIEEGYAAYADLSTIPAQHRGSYVFQSLYGDGQNRLRSITMPSEPQSVCVNSLCRLHDRGLSQTWILRQHLLLRLQLQCHRRNPNEDLRVYRYHRRFADGGGAFTGSGPGVSSPGGGTIKKRRDCKVSFSILAFEFANEVVLRKGFGCAKLVCTTYIFASSDSKSVAAAVATCCAALKAMEMRMPTGHMDENVPKRLMKLEMLDMLKKAGWPMEMRSFWPGERLSFFPRSGISASGPPASSAGCPDYRGDALLLFPEKWRCLWCLVDLVGQVSRGLCQVAHALDVGQVSHGLFQVAHVLDVGQVAHGLCLGCSVALACRCRSSARAVLPIVMKCPGWITRA